MKSKQGEQIICRSCGVLKDKENFYKRTKTRHNTICIECSKKYQKEIYKNDKKKFYHWNKNNRIYLATEIDKLKNNPCKDCGEIYEPFCMDFDHIGLKTDSISLMIHNTWSLEKIKKEIEKTELVCVLCHKTRTHNRLEYSNNKIIKRNREFVLEYKQKSCAICGNNFEPWQMEFDHINDDKFESISKMITSRYSIEKIRKELEKCQVICALCHRRKTFSNGNYKNY